MNNNLFYFSRLILITALFFCFFSVQGQPEVYPADGSTPWTPENLVSQILIGDGLDGVTNVTYTGDLQSLGYFKEAQNDLSIERGLIMSSGSATDAPGINCGSGPCGNTGNNGTASTNTSGGSDPDLVIAGNTGGTNLTSVDASVLEFDFVPNADTLQFRYVFASEEYQQYTCATFSDVFGFFLSGPGISGGLGYTNDGENVALIPGTNIPVSINSLNSGVATGGPAGNCTSLDYDEFFINNINLGLDIEYNGLTTVLTATAVVIPCETYHIKLAISDMSDGQLDSAVFLEAGSFGTNSINVEPYTVSLEGFLAEGCANGVISFTIPEPAEADIPINYTIEGTAQNGVDYTLIPLDLFIPQGEDSIGFAINAFEDGIIEGEETFLLIVEKDICFFDTVIWTIVENPLIEPVMADAVICDGGSTNLDANIPVFQPPPTTFTNTDSEIIAPNFVYQFPIEVSNSPNEILGPGMISSICMNITNSAFIYEVQVYLSTPSGAILELSTQNGAGFVPNGGYINTCFTETASTDINFNPSGDNYAPGSSVPFTGNWQPEAPWSDIYGSNINGTWTLLVTDVAAGFAPTFQDWSITFNSTYFLTYEWDNTATLSCNDCAAPDAFPSTNTTYTVTITDSYGCSVTGDVNVDVVSQLPAPVLTCGASTATSVIVEWTDVGASSYEVNVNGTGWVPVNPGDLFYEVTGLAVGETVTIEVMGLSDDCDDTPISTIDCTAQPCILTTSLDGTTDLTCFQANDGTATLSAIGSGTITYDIVGGGITNTTGIFSNLAVGNYTVSITDDDCTLTETLTITGPLELTASPTFSDVTCNGAADGSITITTLGGTLNYTYQWSGGIADIDETIDGLSGGNYTVTITDDNGCTVTVEQTINENTLLVLTTANTQATCNGIADGTATVSAIGGTGTYDYLWDAAAASQITAIATALDVGTYMVIVTDTDGCSMTTSVDVTAPPAMTTSTSATQASCSGSADGTATVVANGGAGGYTYEWEDGQITDVAINFADGWHYVTVMDSNGCNAIDSAEVTVPNPINLVIDGNNVSCFGGNNGDANVVASGGAGGFSYAWSPGGGTTDAIATITATTYTVIVTDANGCTASASIDITEPDALILAMSSTLVACFGESTGTVTTTVGGGEGAYSYLWATGETTDILSNVSAGIYTVTVTDDNACTIEASQVVTENPLLELTTVTTNANCNDSADGTATVTAIGGTGTYDYLWNNINADITDTATDLDAGTYIVTVTDSDGCITTASVDITAPLAIATSTSFTPTSCSDTADGTATVVATDGAGGFSYEWGNTQNTATTTGLPGGWHYVTVTDVNGCTALDSAEVTVPSAVILAISGNNVSCAGGNDGDATVVVSGGAGGYTYLWTNGEITETIIGLTAGTYTVVVTDANGCTASISIDITEPAALTLAMSSTIVSCFGQSTGTATATVGGGTGIYNYNWSNAGNTDIITGLAAGTYTVTVTDDNLCEIIDQVIVTEQPELTSTMAVGGASCNGGGDGSAIVTPNGGTPPYTYLWNDAQVTAIAVGLMAQTYTVTVTDDLGCTTTNFIDVAEPPALSVAVTGTDISCFAGADGTVSALGNGGDGNYTFAWNVGSGSDLAGLTADIYTVTITDGNGCTAENTITLQQPTEIIVSDVITNVACNGDATGSIIITPSGGTGVYTFLWSDGSTGQNCVNVPVGTYTVIITDSNGCTFTEPYIITEPTALGITLNPSNVFCFMGSDGGINAIVTGGTTPYSYAWTGGFTTQDLSNIPAGTYTLAVTDNNGCIATATTTVNQPAAGVSVSISADETVCFGATTGTAIATATGGAVGYTYQWSNTVTGNIANNLGGGTYTVTVIDGNGCTTSGQMNVNELANITGVMFATPTSCFNGTDGTATVLNISGGVGTIISDYTVVWSTTPVQNGVTAIGLTANEEYTVTITDAFGCMGTSSVVVPNPTEVMVDLTGSTPVTCAGENDGSLTVEGSGGTAPYTYEWDNGQTSEITVNLDLGTYFVTVTDANGCTTSNSYEITNPTMLDVSISGEDTSCPGLNDGTAISYPSGGTQPYIYEWSNGETIATIDSLEAGSYNVTITDANGCMVAASVVVDQPAWLIYTATKTDVTCNGDRDGSIIIEATGGTAPYEYSYDWGDTFEGSNVNVAMYPGYYGVVVRDANGCLSSYESIVIEEPLLVTVNIDPDTPVISYELEDSIQLSAIVDNATGEITYEWSGLYGSQDMTCLDCVDPWLTGYENNIFEVLATDANGCSATDEIEVLVTRERKVFIPSGFTPNGDGVNDALMVHGNSSTRVETFRVYDRWGELVFRADNYAINSTGPSLVWDGTFKGKTMNSGVYIWHVAVKYIDGREETFEGNTSLLR